jgi:hypothetical protein
VATSTRSNVIMSERGRHRGAGRSDLQLALDEMAEAQRGYETAEAQYDGSRGEVFASARLRRALRESGTSYLLRLSRVVVKAVANRMRLAAITSTDPEAQKALARVWKDNQLALEAPIINLRSLLFGDGYVIAWPRFEEEEDEDQPEPDVDQDDDEEEPEEEGPPEAATAVDVFWNEPTTCRVFYDPARPVVPKYAARKWAITSTDQVRVDLLYRNRIERYISKEGVTNVTSDGDLEPYTGDGQRAVLPNPYGRLPVFHFRAETRPYGTPEHEPFYAVADIINKLVIAHMSGVDYHSLPQRYALMEAGASTSDAEATDEDDFAIDPTTSDGDRKEDPESQLSADPGAVWLLRGVKGVGQFPEAEPKVFMDPIREYLRLGAQLSETPMRLFDHAHSALASGESQIQSDGPFVLKVQDRTDQFGATWQELAEFILLLLGFPDAEVTVAWQPPMQVNDKTGWDVLTAKLQAGLPPRQAFMEAGYSADQVDEWFPEEDDDLPWKLELLGKVADVLQRLGSAAAFDLLPRESLLELVKVLLSEPTALLEKPVGDAPPAKPPEDGGEDE